MKANSLAMGAGLRAAEHPGVGEIQAERFCRKEERHRPVLRPRFHPDVSEGNVVQ